MVYRLFIISSIVGGLFGFLGLLGGSDLGTAIVGGVFFAALLWVFFLVVYGLAIGLGRVGGYLIAGTSAFLLLFWHHVLPNVCVAMICHALGIKH